MGWVGRDVELTNERVYALLDEGFEFIVGHLWEGYVEEVVGCGRQRGKVAVEEDCVQDCWRSLVECRGKI